MGVAIGETDTGLSDWRDDRRRMAARPGNRSKGPQHEGWRAADFLSPTVGVAAGLEGEAARIDGSRVVDIRAGRFGLRGLYDVKLGRDDSGWMVGDGGSDSADA